MMFIIGAMYKDGEGHLNHTLEALKICDRLEIENSHINYLTNSGEGERVTFSDREKIGHLTSSLWAREDNCGVKGIKNAKKSEIKLLTGSGS